MSSYRLLAVVVALAAVLVFGLAGLLSVIGGGRASKQPVAVSQSVVPTPNAPASRSSDRPAERR